MKKENFIAAKTLLEKIDKLQTAIHELEHLRLLVASTSVTYKVVVQGPNNVHQVLIPQCTSQLNLLSIAGELEKELEKAKNEFENL